jgi:hypothetical protein
MFAATFVISLWWLWATMVFGGLIYWIPTIVALFRRSRSWGGIALLNFFLGWSLIGWVGALYWAFNSSGTRRNSFE